MHANNGVAPDDPQSRRPDLVSRPIESGDVDAWALLLAAVERTDQQGDHYDADDLAEELSDPALSPATDTLGMWQGEEMVAYAMVRCSRSDQELDRVDVEGAVHPRLRRRGLGRRVLDWSCERGAAAHQEINPTIPGTLRVGTIATNAGASALLEGAGFEPIRYYSGMTRSLDSDIPMLTAPAGLRLASFDPAYDEATRLAHNEAFRDHWGYQPRDQNYWRQWATGSRAFRPHLSFLLLDDAAAAGQPVAAYALCYEYEADVAASGVRDLYIGRVGTRKPWRGKGAASALMSHLLAAAKDAGFETASLMVDAASATGALGLYEGLGFTVRRQRIAYDRPLPDGPTLP